MNTSNFICSTCGVQYEASATPPLSCPICTDDRQYIGLAGQTWTTLEQVNSQHKNIIEKINPDIYAIYTTPSFAINQRAHLIKTTEGNVLWDCIANLDASTIEIIESLGGIKAIAISHPHYFSTIIEWAKSFNAPIYIHSNDAGWLGRRGEAIQLWNGRYKVLWEGVKLVCCGGHFPGASVLHLANDKGALFTGDTIQVAPNLNTVSFMYSYPNMIPLPEKSIIQIRESVKDLDYNAIYGAFGLYIKENAKQAVSFSIERYLNILKGSFEN
jgi:glyoxylase-like metal-dependent hydrolase (beta-lactamase superfamily II)